MKHKENFKDHTCNTLMATSIYPVGQLNELFFR